MERMGKSTVKKQLSIIVGFLAISSWAVKAPEPRYALSIKEGEDLVKFTDKSQWYKDFRQSNLYQGLLLRSGGVLGALPEKDGAWSGRLVDFVVEKILGEKPLHLYYFHKSSLVQPIGLAIQDLGATELKILELLIAATRSAPDQKTEDAELMAIPLSISRQKIALVKNGNCLGISRDPNVAVWSARHCLLEKPLSDDARIRVNVASLASGTERAGRRFFGMNSNVDVQLSGLASGNLKVSQARLPLSESHRIKNVEMHDRFLKALPATTHLLAIQGIPRPQVIEAEDFIQLLAKDAMTTRKEAYFTAAYFFLGASGKERNLDGLLIDQSSSGANAEKWSELFESNLGREIFVKDVCGKSLVLVTPHNKVLSRIEEACSGKLPTLAQAPEALKKILATQSASQAVLVNFGKALASILEHGWTSEETVAMAAEVLEAKKILEAIPAVAMSGEVGANEIVFKGKSGAL